MIRLTEVADKSSRMNSEVYRATTSAHIQPNAESLDSAVPVQKDNQ